MLLNILKEKYKYDLIRTKEKKIKEKKVNTKAIHYSRGSDPHHMNRVEKLNNGNKS